MAAHSRTPEEQAALAAFLRQREDEALARGEPLWFICEHCRRDFLSKTRESFCSLRCRQKHEHVEADAGAPTEQIAVFTLPDATDAEDTPADDDHVWDPRIGRYRTKSWTKWV